METETPPAYDVSALPDWRGLRPGMPRAEAMALLKAAGQDDADDPSDPDWALVGDWSMDLTFDGEGDRPLQQIAVTDPAFGWKGAPLIGRPLAEVAALLGPAAENAAWRPENAIDFHGKDREPLDETPCRDEDLLARGTLWLPKLRLGLTLDEGRVKELAWRRREAFPLETAGGLTAQQLALASRPASVATAKHRLSLWRCLIQGVALLALLGVLIFGLQTHLQWQASPSAAATVTAIHDPSQEVPKGRYLVRFTDERGISQNVPLERADFYVAPREIGEQVEVRYLLLEPIRVVGPARFRDAAFLTVVPRVLVAGTIFTFLQLFLGWRQRK